MDNNKSEFKLIEWIRQNSKAGNLTIQTGIGDDMAIMEVGGEKILVTCDMLLEGVHFVLEGHVGPGFAELRRENQGPTLQEKRCAVHTLPAKPATLEQVGYKAMACSLSDCAAMAAVPWCAVVSVALPNSLAMTDAQQLHKGLQQAAEKYTCPIIGGDTTSWYKPLAINVSILAKAAGVEPVLRSGAQVGDALFVTGELGGSFVGRHLEFTPRVEEARKLAEMVDLHAMIDISDGLAQDLSHICTESNVGAIINQRDIPISTAARQTANPLQAALTDGEDFELLFCLSPKDAIILLAQWSESSSTKLTQIGNITEAKDQAKLFMQDEDGKLNPVTPKGWEHFT